MNWFSLSKIARCKHHPLTKHANAYSLVRCQKCMQEFAVDLNQTHGENQTNSALATDIQKVRLDPSLSNEERTQKMQQMLAHQERTFSCPSCHLHYLGEFAGEGFIQPSAFHPVNDMEWEQAHNSGVFEADAGLA